MRSEIRGGANTLCPGVDRRRLLILIFFCETGVSFDELRPRSISREYIVSDFVCENHYDL